MVNPVELYFGDTLLFRFNPTPTNIVIDIQKSGASPMDLPTYIRPWMFDFTSQDRRITINAVVMNNITPFTAGTSGTGAGTGSMLDQIEDLLFIMSGNWLNRSIVAPNNLLYLTIPYSYPLNAGHNLAAMYTVNDNSDASFDAASVPSSSSWPTGNIALISHNGYDKIHFVYPTGFTINRAAATVNMIPITLTFIEVQESIKI